MRSVEGFRILDQPLIANGPGIVLPLSAVFAIWGIGLMQARMLMAVYFVSAALVFFRVSSRLSGTAAALISTLILLAIPTEGFILFGRQALGNVPALAYFLVGFTLFLELAKRKALIIAVLSGVFFGLALVTKGQYWVLIPALGLLILADWVYYKQVGIKRSIMVLIVTFSLLLIWQTVQFYMAGAENYNLHLSAVSSSAKVTVFAFRIMRIPGNIWYLMRSGFLVFVLPGLALAIWDSRERTLHGLGRFFLVSFVMMWITWYLFASVGWHRYAFEAYSIGILVSGRFIVRFYEFIRFPQSRYINETRIKQYLKAINDFGGLVHSRVFTAGYSRACFQRFIPAGICGILEEQCIARCCH
jgi:4-amino-4-deoxy-L-arabinose transferase-like glycosyltransferase